MDFWRFLSFVLLELSAAAPIHIPGEVARSSCALARHDCSRKGRRPLRAGGILLPILDARIHLCDGCRSSQRTVLEDIESLFEAAVLNSSLELRPHLATLMEYSKRARSVLQVGTSDTAWIAILQGGLQRSDGQLYQTELAANLMDFLQQHDLRSLGIRVLEGYAASEMLFFSSWRMDFESLAAKSAMAKFILLHGTKYSGENDDGHGSQGTVFFEGLQRWLNNNRAWQLAEYSSLGAGLAVLIRSHRTSRNCSNAWAPAQSFASELLEVRHGYPSLLGSTWHVRPAAVTAMHRRLAAIQSRCPDAKAALRVLQLFSSKDPQMLQGLMESSTTKKYREAIPEPISLGTLDAALNHPELSLLLLHRGQLPDEDRHRLLDVSVAQWPHRFEFWQILADDLVFRRLENVDVPSAMQAIRRCFSLAHFDRSVVFRLLEMLEVLWRPREATLLWDAVAGSPTAPWDDQRRSAASAVSVPQVFAENAAVFPGEAFLNKHPEFKFARDYMEAFSDDLLTEQLDIIRTYSATKVNGYCKDNGWCEYVFLMFEYCQFLTECGKVPQTCKAAKKMEENGLRILRASLSLAGSPEVDVDDEHRRKVYIQPHASPEIGRMRLSCTLLVSAQTSSTLRLEGERPRVYRQGKCFWFDESMTHEMDFEATGPDTLRATLYLDALHPGYYQEREVHYYPGEDTLPWWQTILQKMGTPPTPLTNGLIPRRYMAPPLKPAPWLSLAVDSQFIKADICLRGDLGLLFHQNTFWTPGDHSRALVMLQLFSRMQLLLHLGRQDPDVMHIFYRNRDFTQKDLDQLTQDTWACMALGCKGCEALELFGLCWDDLAPTILVSLFRGFAQTMHLSIHAIKTWFEILGFSFPPPGGYGLTTEQLNGIFTEKAAEIQAFFETM